MLFARSILGLSVLLAPAGEEAPAGGSSAPAGEAAPPPKEDGKLYTQAQLDAMFQERVNRAKGSVLADLTKHAKDLGFDSVEAMQNAAKAAKAAEEAQKTEAQKLREQAETAKKEAEAYKAQASTAAEKARRAELFVEHDVSPKQRKVVDVLLSQAREEQGQAFDEASWFANLKTESPYLFRGEAAKQDPAKPVGASTGAAGGAPPPPAGGGQPNGSFNAMTAKPEEVENWARSQGIDPRFFPRR